MQFLPEDYENKRVIDDSENSAAMLIARSLGTGRSRTPLLRITINHQTEGTHPRSFPSGTSGALRPRPSHTLRPANVRLSASAARGFALLLRIRPQWYRDITPAARHRPLAPHRRPKVSADHRPVQPPQFRSLGSVYSPALFAIYIPSPPSVSARPAL